MIRCQAELLSEDADMEKLPLNADEKDESEKPFTFSRIAPNESNQIVNYFTSELTTIIQQIITNLLYLSYPQIIAFLLTIFPIFPPVTIVGIFIMVILSILQNPFVQKILPNLNALAKINFTKEMGLPKTFLDKEKSSVNDVLKMISEGRSYATKSANEKLENFKLGKHSSSLDLNQSDELYYGNKYKSLLHRHKHNQQ